MIAESGGDIEDVFKDIRRDEKLADDVGLEKSGDLEVLAVPPKCAVNQPQRSPSQHDSVTVWHLGHSRCARTNMGASVVPQYLERGGSIFLGFYWVDFSDCMMGQWLVATTTELSRLGRRNGGCCCHYRFHRRRVFSL